MLIEFSVENYRSFKDEVTLSMIASDDDTLMDNVIKEAQGTNLNLLKSAVIYGANASGKSNLIRALKFMSDFVVNSLDASIPVSQFRLDESCLFNPSRFEIAFLYKGIRYVYGFSVTRNQVYEEWFHSYPKGQKRVLFHRNRDRKRVYSYGTHWKGEKERLQKATRPDALFISVASRFNNKIAQIVVDWFSHNLTEQCKSMDLSDPKQHEIAMQYLKAADLGITDIEFDGRGGIITTHLGKDFSGKNKNIEFNLRDESAGTRKFFAKIGLWDSALKNGGRLLENDLDIQYHTLLTRWMIEMFYDENRNPHGAQLIFSTHDTGLLDDKMFRKDQIWFTEKNRDGATDLYSLYDLKGVNNTENFRKGYLMGRYGAIPFIGEL